MKYMNVEMREHKYRVWDKKEKKWALSHYTDEMYLNPKGVLVEPNYGGDGIETIEEVEKDRYIVVFYTGLKDKNDKESYHNDIGKDVNGVFRIEWAKTGWARFYDMDAPEEEYKWISLGTGLAFEIIGNRFENPELLKENKQR